MAKAKKTPPANSWAAGRVAMKATHSQRAKAWARRRALEAGKASPLLDPETRRPTIEVQGLIDDFVARGKVTRIVSEYDPKAPPAVPEYETKAARVARERRAEELRAAREELAAWDAENARDLRAARARREMRAWREILVAAE